ncbi:MAG: BrnA antitoxin family protein [bacterium]
MPNLNRLTARQNAQYHYMMDVMRRLEWDLHNRIEMSGRIPPEWHDIAKDPKETPKRQVNVALEEDVLKFFKSLGKGYGAKINLVLKSFMHARLAGIVEGAETLNHFKQRNEVHSGPKPQFGDVAREFGEDWEDAPGPASRVTRKARQLEVLRKAQADRDEVGD